MARSTKSDYSLFALLLRRIRLSRLLRRSFLPSHVLHFVYKYCIIGDAHPLADACIACVHGRKTASNMGQFEGIVCLWGRECLRECVRLFWREGGEGGQRGPLHAPYTYICTHTHTCTYTYTYTHTHKHTHTHSHTLTHSHRTATRGLWLSLQH